MPEPEDSDAANKLPDSRSQNSPRLLRPVLELAAAWRELRFARKSGRQALDRYRLLKINRPDLSGRALYEAFVCERNSIEYSAARAILKRAEDTFAAWPNERDLLLSLIHI